jgi:nucleotide-binding universal stress UspA family protein
MTRLVVGIDGSACSREALKWAEGYAKATSTSITLVTAWHWPMSYGVPVAYEGFDPEEDSRKVLEAAAADLSLPSSRVSKLVEQGQPGDVLIHAAKPGDLLVVGSRGHGALASAFLGSTSSYCVHHAKCPVVVVR